VYLASLPADRAVQFIQERELRRYTEKTIADKNDYIAEINQVRQNGYAIDDEEYLPGVRAVAVGVGNHRGLPLALWVVGFAGAMEKDVLPDIIRYMQQTAHRLQIIIDSRMENVK
jgi:DNA-binding IclR family transcriptional regulator